LGYRLKIVTNHPKGWIEGERTIDKEFDLINEAIEEINRIVGHQIKYGDIILINLEKEK